VSITVRGVKLTSLGEATCEASANGKRRALDASKRGVKRIRASLDFLAGERLALAAALEFAFGHGTL
jgi:hypothetical protein